MDRFVRVSAKIHRRTKCEAARMNLSVKKLADAGLSDILKNKARLLELQTKKNKVERFSLNVL